MKKLKHYYLRLLSYISKKHMFNYAYNCHRGKLPNYKNPQDLSEFILSQSLQGNINKLYKYADKYAVRNYIIAKGYENILVKLLGVYESVEEVKLNDLPSKYVIKLNNGCGLNIVNYGIDLKLEEVKVKLINWFKKTNYKYEEHYNLIEPKILIEEFVIDLNPKLKTTIKTTEISDTTKDNLPIDPSRKNFSFEKIEIDSPDEKLVIDLTVFNSDNEDIYLYKRINKSIL